jgi:lipopolysaccharide export system protein LptA
VHLESSGGLEYDYKARKGVATGNPLVKLTREDMMLQCHRLAVQYDPAGDISRAVCTGDVKLTRREQMALCSTATYEGEKARVLCENPVLHDGQSVLRGELLIYQVDTDQFRMSHPKGDVVPKPGQRMPVHPGGSKTAEAPSLPGAQGSGGAP